VNASLESGKSGDVGCHGCVLSVDERHPGNYLTSLVAGIMFDIVLFYKNEE
jgi:hypothetical protein